MSLLHPASAPVVAASFEDRLQLLISAFWEGRDDTDPDETLAGLQHLFISMARELGRIDGVARLFGIPREESLSLLRLAFADGKQAALSQHERTSANCTCQEADVLMLEINYD